MSLNTITLSDMTRLADFQWLKGLESVPNMARESGIFNNTIFPANSGDTIEYNEIDLEEYSSEKAEGDQAESARVQQGYTKILRLRRFGKNEKVTWEMRRRNKYQNVLKRITNLASMQAKRLDLDLSHRITFGTATSYVDKDGVTVDTSIGDGFALFYTAHTLKGSATTFRNRLANNPQVSKGAIENMEKMRVENTYNQFGEKMTIDADIIWSGDDPNTNNTIREYLQSTAAIDAPNAGVVNVYQAKYTNRTLPRIATTAAGDVDTDKSKYWGLASSTNSSAFLAMEQEPTLSAPSSGSNGEDISNDDWIYKGRTSYGITIVGASFISMSSGDGTA